MTAMSVDGNSVQYTASPCPPPKKQKVTHEGEVVPTPDNTNDITEDQLLELLERNNSSIDPKWKRLRRKLKLKKAHIYLNVLLTLDSLKMMKGFHCST